MNILAIDSSNKKAQIALYKNELKFVHEMEETKSHSEFLLKEIEDFLNEFDIKIQDIDCLSINVGPGSFTGIRIGISFVKAFMFALNQKCVVVNNFELISYSIKNKPKSYFVVLSSNNEDFYVSKFDGDKVSFLSLNAQKLNEIVKISGEKVYCSYQEKDCFEGLINLVPTNIDKTSFIDLSVQKVKNNQFKTINEICPLYIKKSQAEIGLLQKLEQNLVIKNSCEISQIVLLEQKCFEDAYSKTLLEQDIKNPLRHQFFAFYNTELVGYINFEQTFDELNLFKICVLSEFREYGIGTKLMQKMIEFFDENKELKTIFLEVDSKNLNAQKLYEKFGFKQISIRKNYYKNGDDAIIYALKKCA